MIDTNNVLMGILCIQSVKDCLHNESEFTRELVISNLSAISIICEMIDTNNVLMGISCIQSVKDLWM